MLDLRKSDPDYFFEIGLIVVYFKRLHDFLEVPRGALAPELSKDYDQRNKIGSIGMMFGWAGGAGIDFIARYYWLDSFVDFDGYQILAFWGGIGIFIGTAVTTIGTHRNIPELHTPPTRSFKLSAFLAETKETLWNRSWLVLFTSGVFYSLLLELSTGVGTYYNNYLWQWKPKDNCFWSLITPICVVCLTIIAPYIALVGRNKKKNTVGIFLTTIIIGPMPMALDCGIFTLEQISYRLTEQMLIWWIFFMEPAMAH